MNTSTEHPLTKQVISKSKIAQKPAVDKVLLEMCLERFEDYFNEKNYGNSQVLKKELSERVFELIYDYPAINYVILLIRENSDLINYLQEYLKSIQELNSTDLESIKRDIFSVKEVLDSFSIEEFSKKLTYFNTKVDVATSLFTEIITEIITKSNEVVTQNVLDDKLTNFNREILSKVTLKNDLDEFRKEICGDNNSEGLLENRFRTLHGKINSFLSHRLDRFDKNLSRKIDTIDNELKGFQRYFPGIVNGLAVAVVLFGGYASLAGFVNHLVGSQLTNQLEKDGGIQTQINDLQSQVNILQNKVNENRNILGENKILLQEIAKNQGIDPQNVSK